MLATHRLRRLANQVVFPARQLTKDAFSTDLHLHTDYTDGRSSIAEMLGAADAAGLKAIAFTEHVRRGITWYEGFASEVGREAKRYPNLRVLQGLEAKAIDLKGHLDADPSLIASVDLVLGACHNYPDAKGGFVPADQLTASQAALAELQACWHMLDHPELDVLAHPGGLTRKHFGHFPDAFLKQLIRKAARLGRAIELNAEYSNPAQLAQLLRWCHSANAWVTIGSNAHHASEVGRLKPAMTELVPYAS